MQTNFQMKFSPVSRNVTNMGTTVTYCTEGSYNSGVVNPTVPTNFGISAFNQNIPTSGNFVGSPQWQYNNAFQPTISATHINPLVSGNMPRVYQNPYVGWCCGDAIVQPTVDISETTSDVVVTAHVPYVNQNDITLNVTENSVTLSGHTWTGNESLLINRTVALPTSIRAEAVDASLQSGILEIRLPKAEKSVRSRTTLTQNPIQK